jgi:hypothetical protein
MTLPNGEAFRAIVQPCRPPGGAIALLIGEVRYAAKLQD